MQLVNVVEAMSSAHTRSHCSDRIEMKRTATFAARDGGRYTYYELRATPHGKTDSHSTS